MTVLRAAAEPLAALNKNIKTNFKRERKKKQGSSNMAEVAIDKTGLYRTCSSVFFSYSRHTV